MLSKRFQYMNVFHSLTKEWRNIVKTIIWAITIKKRWVYKYSHVFKTFVAKDLEASGSRPNVMNDAMSLVCIIPRRLCYKERSRSLWIMQYASGLYWKRFVQYDENCNYIRVRENHIYTHSTDTRPVPSLSLTLTNRRVNIVNKL